MTLDQQVEAFHEELRRKNRSILFWGAVVFNVAYVAWTVFDHVLEPDLAREFLVIRLCASTFNTALVVTLLRTRLGKYIFEGFGLWLLVFGACITPMLAQTRDSLAEYAMGFSLIPFAAGLLPFWPPRWSISVITLLAALGLGGVIFGEAPLRDVIASAFFIATGTGMALFMGWYKYAFSRRDYFTSAELEAAVRRESDARARLSQTTSDLDSALTRLQENDKRKNTFFANVSHELRTPLTLILAPVEELLGRETDETSRRSLAMVRRNAERLLRLIDDILDLSRLDAGGLRLTLAEVDLRAVAQIVAENAEPAASAKGISLAFDADVSSRRSHGDSHRLEIILTNLVGNAVKYTPRGGAIQLSVRDDESGVVVEVRDNGPGIAAEDLPRVFDRFFQAGKNDRRTQGGVGIGLALARELTELHGGRLEVASNVGQGTTFILRLPFGRDHIRPEAIERRQRQAGVRLGRRAEDLVPSTGELATPSMLDLPAMPIDQPTGERPPSAAGLVPRRARVLVVDDNDELRQFMTDLLAAEHDVMVARDGGEALEMVRRERPDLVVSDVMMPIMTGVELCQTIKADAGLAGTPVILLTARAGADATLEGYAHGADDFVAKPFHPRVLAARVRAQLRLRELGMELARREKLAAVGTLAAGVLHEVRNPVNAVLNAARVLLTSQLPEDRRRKLLELVVDAGERINGITQILDAHARPADGGMSATTDLRQGLEGTLRLLEHRLEAVSVTREYAAVPEALAPAGPINQVLLNLVDNALKAGAHALTLSLSAPERGQVLVRVGDDGPGVPADAAARIFEPFVTGGGGSGLGLYVSRRIVEEHRGRIWCEPRQGGGTWFNVLLPAADGSPQGEANG